MLLLCVFICAWLSRGGTVYIYGVIWACTSISSKSATCQTVIIILGLCMCVFYKCVCVCVCVCVWVVPCSLGNAAVLLWACVLGSVLYLSPCVCVCECVCVCVR